MNDRQIDHAPDFTWSELGSRIRDLRVAHRMTQQDLATAADLSQPGLYQIEVGKTNPQLPTLQGIAAALNTTVRALLCGPAVVEETCSSGLLQRVQRIAASRDELVLRTLMNGLEAAEALLDERSRRLPRRKVQISPDPLQLKPGQRIVRRFVGEGREGPLYGVIKPNQKERRPGKTEMREQPLHRR